jgi:hypothetical protein
MSSFTPGPWEVGSTIESDTQAIIHDGDSVLAILTTIPPNPANARLIAAAPDLLEFAMRVCFGECDSIRSLIQQGRDAISKATGEA